MTRTAATRPVDWGTEVIEPTLHFLAEGLKGREELLFPMRDEMQLWDRLEKDGWFRQLEEVEKIRLPDPLQIRICIAVTEYDELGPEWNAHCASQYQKAAKLCGDMALSMRPLVNALRAIYFRNPGIPTPPIASPLADLPAPLRDMDWRDVRIALRSIERSLSKTAMSIKRDPRARTQDDKLIIAVADVFYTAGGHIALSSEDGPWVRFLSKIWDVLPLDSRPENASALVTRDETKTQATP
jgi:hypothetical protein